MTPDFVITFAFSCILNEGNGREKHRGKKVRKKGRKGGKKEVGLSEGSREEKKEKRRDVLKKCVHVDELTLVCFFWYQGECDPGSTLQRAHLNLQKNRI